MNYPTQNPPRSAKITLKIETEDRIGDLKKISSILSALGINIKKTTARLAFWDKKRFISKYCMEIEDFNILLKLINHLEEIEKESKWIRKICS